MSEADDSMIAPPDGPPIDKKLFIQKCAKFTINELSGIVKKHGITFKELERLIERQVVIFLIYAICQGRITTGQARKFINDKLEKALRKEARP